MLTPGMQQAMRAIVWFTVNSCLMMVLAMVLAIGSTYAAAPFSNFLFFGAVIAFFGLVCAVIALYYEFKADTC